MCEQMDRCEGGADPGSALGKQLKLVPPPHQVWMTGISFRETEEPVRRAPKGQEISSLGCRGTVSKVGTLQLEPHQRSMCSREPQSAALCPLCHLWVAGESATATAHFSTDNTPGVLHRKSVKNGLVETSLVVQWLRIRLPMQGTRV